MKSCFIFSQEKRSSLPLCQSEIHSPFSISPETTCSLPFMIEAILLDSSEQIFLSNTIYDYNRWAKIPQVISQKKKNSFENMNLYKQVLTKSKLFKSEFSSQLYESISMGKGQMCFVDFNRFYEELDQAVNNQRIFYYFNKCNEFVLQKDNFENCMNNFIKSFKKILKSSNLILDCLIKKNQQIEDIKTDYLYLDYIKLVSDFKNSVNRNSISSFFPDNESKIDKKKFLNTLTNCKTFPLFYLFEFLRLEKIAINLSLKSNSLANPENKQRSIIKKFLMNEIKKTLKRCNLNGNLSCLCSFCKWFFDFFLSKK